MGQSIDREQVLRVGHLARIELTDEEVETFSRQLSDILEYANKLSELDTEQVEPMAHPLPLTNVFREDEAGPTLTVAEALANAPERDGDFFKVPKVLGGEHDA